MYRSAFLAICLVPLALAADITGQVLLDPFPNHVLPVGSKVVLDHGVRSALILYDGTFALSDVPEGEHILDTLIPGYSLPTTLYNINSTSIHAQPYITSRLPLPISTPSLPLPLTLIAAPDDYYTSPPGVNILGMLKNPMVLMMLFSGIMMFFMPKIMASMENDPDMAEEMANMQKKMQKTQNMDLMGSYVKFVSTAVRADSSLSSILSGEQATPAPAPAASGGGGGGNGSSSKKGRRR